MAKKVAKALERKGEVEKRVFASRTSKLDSFSRVRLCEAGFLIKKWADDIFDCILCQTTVFGRITNHLVSAGHKKSAQEKCSWSYGDQEKAYRERSILAKSEATAAIVKNVAAVNRRFPEDFTYDCYLCHGARDVSAFHFLDKHDGSRGVGKRERSETPEPPPVKIKKEESPEPPPVKIKKEK